MSKKQLFCVRIWNKEYSAPDMRVFFILAKSSKSLIKFLKDAEIIQEIHNYEIKKQIKKLQYGNPHHHVAEL